MANVATSARLGDRREMTRRGIVPSAQSRAASSKGRASAWRSSLRFYGHRPTPVHRMAAGALFATPPALGFLNRRAMSRDVRRVLPGIVASPLTSCR